MGGGGFMEHANSTNRLHRSQKQNRRKKFKNDQSDKVGTREDVLLKFIDSDSKSAKEYRSLLDQKLQTRRRMQLIVTIGVIMSLVGLVLYVFWLIGFV